MKNISLNKILILTIQSLVIIFIVLGIGYNYNKNIPQKYFVTYETEITGKTKIYLGTIDRLLIKLDLIGKGSISHTLSFVTDRMESSGYTIKTKPEYIGNIIVSESKVRFDATNKDNLNKDVDKIIAEINKALRLEINDMLDLYYLYATQFINEEIQYTLSQLDKLSALSKDIEEQGLGNSTVQEKYFLKEFVNKVFSSNSQGLSANELLDVFNTFNITKNLENISYLREIYLNADTDDNIDLRRMKRLRNELEGVDIISGKYFVDVVNQKPPMKHTLLACFILGIFISFTYIYLYLLNAKKPILKRIKALRNLR